MKTHRSACPMDCPDACSLNAEVEDGRVVVLDGSEVNSVTRGYICAKIRRFPRIMYGKERIRKPAIRVGEKGEGKFREVSWDTALDLIAEELTSAREEFGGEAILPFSYGGSNGVLSQDTTDARLFWRLGASNLARTVCAVPTGRAAEGLYGKMAGVAYPDYLHARLIVVWGANPEASGIHLLPYIQDAQKQGARLVVIDPRRTKLAARADLHLGPRPGTDLPLALSIINWLFAEDRADLDFLEEHATGAEKLRESAAKWGFDRAAEACEIPAADIESFARMYAEHGPAVIRCGWGLERNRNGGSAATAVLALPAIAGKFGVRGGGYTMSNSSVWRFETEKAASASPPPTRTVNMNRLGRALTETNDSPIRFLFVYNCNPLATMPNQEKVRSGLGRDDLFTVVFDSFMTDTASYADVVLPATTFLERREILRGYGAYALQDAKPVATPVGESRTNHDVFLALCNRLGLSQSGDPQSEDEVAAALLSTENGEGFRRSLEEHGIAHPEFGETPVQFVDVFPRTEHGKVDLFPAALDREAAHGLYHYQPDPATDDFPLALISPATNRTVSSTLGQLDKRQIPLEIHPDDAGIRGIEDGATVRVWNTYGEVRCHARITSRIRTGVVELPKGMWSHNTLSGTTANALAPDTLTDLGEGACFNDARVQVESLRA